MGETGVAFISLKPDTTLEEKDLISHCIENLAKFKVPSKVEFVEALPRNATGKVLKELFEKITLEAMLLLFLKSHETL